MALKTMEWVQTVPPRVLYMDILINGMMYCRLYPLYFLAGYNSIEIKDIDTEYSTPY